MLQAAAGDVIQGKYRVERVIGEGGMGVVLAATHLQLAELVAIKLPVARRSERADVSERLTREGRAAMRIRSEHVARVYDVGVLENGQPYLVMEYLAGRDLAALLSAEGPLPVDQALEYLLQACEALAEAHAAGVIHRDLKPSNLFLTRRADGSALLKVIDFGVSKLTSNAALTHSAALLGSPAYMAPEQMRAAREIDARSDIWGLGATLYALLSGQPPFPGNSLVDIYEQIAGGPRPLRESRKDVPIELEAIIARCLQKVPLARYSDVAELSLALSELAPAHARASAQRAGRILRGAAELSLQECSAAPPLDGAPTVPTLAASWSDNFAQIQRNSTLGHSALNGHTTRPRRSFAALRNLTAVAIVAAAILTFWRVQGAARASAESRPTTATATATASTASQTVLLQPETATLSASAMPPTLALTDSAVATARPMSTSVTVPSTRARPPAAPNSRTTHRAQKPEIRDPLADPD